MILRTSSGAPEYIVAGLGNPGEGYARTRHNAGFAAAEAAAREYGVKFTKKRFESLWGTGKIAGRNVMILKPQTYMNLSGVMRIRQKGSDGGQRGMRSIIGQCGTDEIMRIKLGVGKKPTPEYDLADWVLSKMSEAEYNTLLETAERAAKALPLLIDGRIEEAMNLYSR